MAITLTWPLTSDGVGAVTYTANNWRTLLTNLFSEGILGATSFDVSERAAGANMTLDVTAGVAVLAGDDAVGQGNYLVEATATLGAFTIGTADASNPRIDRVGIQLNDPSEGGAAGRNCTFVTVPGTAAASPSAPALPDSFFELAQVTVPAAATSIVNANITDTRVSARSAHDTIATDQVTTAKILDSAVTTAKIADANVTGAKIAGFTITAGNIAGAAITNPKIGAGAVGTPNIADSVVTTAKIADSNVTTAKIAANAVTAAKIADATVTEAKLSDSLASEQSGAAVNGWGGTVYYWKVGNVVSFIYGSAGSVATSDTIFTFPVGYRPSRQAVFAGYANSGGSETAVISSGGVMAANSAGTFLYVTGTFLV